MFLQVDDLSQPQSIPVTECPVDLGQVHVLFTQVCNSMDCSTIEKVSKQLKDLVQVQLPESMKSISDVGTAHILSSLVLLPMAQEVELPTNVSDNMQMVAFCRLLGIASFSSSQVSRF